MYRDRDSINVVVDQGSARGGVHGLWRTDLDGVLVEHHERAWINTLEQSCICRSWIQLLARELIAKLFKRVIPCPGRRVMRPVRESPRYHRQQRRVVTVIQPKGEGAFPVVASCE